jgi:hypothetical protein
MFNNFSIIVVGTETAKEETSRERDRKEQMELGGGGAVTPI